MSNVCQDCDNIFLSDEEYKAHLNLACPDCDNSYCLNDLLDIHKLTHTNEATLSVGWEHFYSQFADLLGYGHESVTLCCQNVDAEEINALFKTSYKAMDTTYTECSICLIPFSQGEMTTFLPCHHPYHPQCIQTWLTSHITCPLCRTSVRQ